MEATKDALISIDSNETGDHSRRLHGSFRAGDAAFPEPAKTFNLRPSIDDLPEEQSLTIEINGWSVATLICSPSAIIELALGWSFARGYFDDPDQVTSAMKFGDRVSIMLNHAGPRGEPWDGDLSSGFDPALWALGVNAGDNEANSRTAGMDEQPDLRFDPVQFISIAERVFSRIRASSNSDGVHHAAVSDGDQLSAIARDVCRQNAVDKIIGWTINQRSNRRSLILCVSGRVTADIAAKASRAGFPMVVSRSVPTCEAVEIAHSHGITLVGCILDQQRAIYAHPWRLSNLDSDL
jgi:FdhD protein